MAKRHGFRMLIVLSVCLLLSGVCSSCAALGLVAQAIPITVHARYPGLKGQTVGVLVWADRGILIDWDPIRLDLAHALEDPGGIRLHFSMGPEL